MNTFCEYVAACVFNTLMMFDSHFVCLNCSSLQLYCEALNSLVGSCCRLSQITNNTYLNSVIDFGLDGAYDRPLTSHPKHESMSQANLEAIDCF